MLLPILVSKPTLGVDPPLRRFFTYADFASPTLSDFKTPQYFILPFIFGDF